MRLGDIEYQIRKKLAKAGVDSPGLCARLLAAHATGLNKIQYLLGWETELPGEICANIARLADRRAKGEPLAYILGNREFYGYDFEVTKATLIPRPETELLVDLALKFLPADKRIVFCDAGCGSGCIGLSLMAEMPDWKGILVDISAGALEVARRNANNLALSPLFIQADFAALPFSAESLDLLVSNPPYIARSRENLVMASTLAWEPRLALFSERDGLANLADTIAAGKIQLKQGGFIILEHDCNQGEAVKALLKEADFAEIADYNDLAGLSRCAVAQKRR